MKIFDTLFGRTQPVKANLDGLFALPSAALTLQAAAGYLPTGRAGVCFMPPAGQQFADTQSEIERLLSQPDDAGAPGVGTTAQVHLQDVADRYGYRWILAEAQRLDDLVNQVHLVHSGLSDAGWGPQLLCSVFGFAGEPATPNQDVGAAADDDDESVAAGPSTLYFVYLAKRGTFYPFAPTGTEQRDSELELRLRAAVGADLPIEPEIARWFPIWDLPVR